MQVNYDTYELMDFTCKSCGWTGKGKELSNRDFSEDSFIGDLLCPKCLDMIAHWQAPLS
ncbi:hypothetical protein ABIB40_003101 [Pedobacter sp. UYP30]|uniref:hypothetical protein n=1 Tax=Pedobacter sp. UYP30 TaxID=1756400 RepID=UPI0033928CBE